jgi:tetratricopeptide (TPR) repeat protein
VGGRSHQEVIEALEKQLAATPRSSRPYEHAALSYRLGLALAESPTGGVANLRRALAYYDAAAGIFDPRFDPVEHARVLNAAGAAHRALTDRKRAAGLFAQAADLLADRDRDQERAASLNNLGLVRSEMGDAAGAVEAFDEAADLFDADSAEGRRGRVATLHNRGLAHAAMGTEQGLEEALDDYRRALAELDPDDAPYHYGLVHHSLGVAYSTLAGMRGADRERLLAEAEESFTESLTIFTRTDFPYQYALTKHNLGLALLGQAQDGDVKIRRRAMASFEDAVAVLDPRLHADAWQQAYASLAKVEEELGRLAPGLSRAGHFVALAAASKADERRELMSERLLRLLSLPDAPRHSALGELALASAQLGDEQTGKIAESELSVLMELPNEHLEAALRARVEAHRQLDPERQEHADRALDQAIGDALQGPQRVRVRDFLYSIGWERP